MVDAAIADADASPAIDAMPPAGMVAISRTTFTMGCNQTLDTNCQSDELPPTM